MRNAVVLLSLLLSGCTVVVTTCYPLAKNRANSCPINDDWRKVMQDAHERGMCSEKPFCCEIDGRWCCDKGGDIACQK